MTMRLIQWKGRSFLGGEPEAIVQWGFLGEKFFAEIQRADNLLWYVWLADGVQGRTPYRRAWNFCEEAKEATEELVPELVRLAHACKEAR